MKRNEPSFALQSPSEKTGCLPAILRATWMAFGNLAVFFCAIFAARRPAPSPLDFLYIAIVAALIAIRWLDIAKFRGQTADGEPATMAHWRRYALGLVPISAGIWALMRFAHTQGWL